VNKNFDATDYPPPPKKKKHNWQPDRSLTTFGTPVWIYYPPSTCTLFCPVETINVSSASRLIITSQRNDGDAHLSGT